MFDITDLEGTSVVAKLLRLLLLLTLKDKAEQICFERMRSGHPMKMSYRVSGQWLEMIPPPAHLAQEIVAELKRMACISDSPLHRQRFLARLLWKSSQLPARTQTGWITFRVKSIVVNIWAKFFPELAEDRVLLDLHPERKVAQKAKMALEQCLYRTAVTPLPRQFDIVDEESPPH